MFFFLLLISFLNAQEIHYVSENGTDGPQCGISLDSPCKTIYYVINNLQSVTDIIVSQGTFIENSTKIPELNLTIRGESVILRPSLAVNDQNPTNTFFLEVVAGEVLTLKWLVLLHTSLTGSFVNNVFIRIINDGTVIIDSCSFSVRVSGAGASYITGSLIESIDSEESTVARKEITINNCSFSNFTGQSIELIKADNVLKLSLVGNTFNNTSSNNNSAVLTSFNAAQITLSNNTFENIASASDGGAIYIKNFTVNLTISGNSFKNVSTSNGDGGALWIAILANGSSTFLISDITYFPTNASGNGNFLFVSTVNLTAISNPDHFAPFNIDRFDDKKYIFGIEHSVNDTNATAVSLHPVLWCWFFNVTNTRCPQDCLWTTGSTEAVQRVCIPGPCFRTSPDTCPTNCYKEGDACVIQCDMEFSLQDNECKVYDCGNSTIVNDKCSNPLCFVKNKECVRECGKDYTPSFTTSSCVSNALWILNKTFNPGAIWALVLILLIVISITIWCIVRAYLNKQSQSSKSHYFASGSQGLTNTSLSSSLSSSETSGIGKPSGYGTL